VNEEDAISVPSRKILEPLQKDCLRIQMYTLPLLEERLRTPDLCLQYLTEVYSLSGEILKLIDSYMYGAEEGDEVYIGSEEITSLKIFTAALQSVSLNLRDKYSISFQLI
jgi:hypothetical protein